VRIAVLADVHGNLPALRSVLAALDRDQAEAIVVAGDVVGGPFVAETLELLRSRTERVHWISGNSEREAVAAYDGAPVADDEPGRAAAWSAQALDRRWRDELASWPISLALDGVRFCHGSPRRDDEILTRATPEDVLLDALSGVRERLVVGGHTHQQLVRTVHPGLVYANAGSVGMPYEGHPGAFWMVIADGVPEPRETGYDLAPAVAELRSSGYADVDGMLQESLIDPVSADWVTAYFEHAAGRGPDPGEIPR
jgi:putative phosphoesterase